MLETLVQDVKLALRSLLREKLVTAVAVGSLAVGLAANTTVFSLVQAVEFPRLIYPDAARVVFLESRHQARGLSAMPVSAPDSLDVTSAVRTLELASLTADRIAIVDDTAGPVRRSGRQVAPTFFDVFRIRARQGRTLTQDDADGTVVISDRLWRARFGGETGVVGKTIHLDGVVRTVVGVMPVGFDGDADFWVPLGPVTAAARDDRRFTTWARLAPGSSIGDATREIRAVSARLASEFPATNNGWEMFPTPVTRIHGQDSRGVFFLLQGAVALVLLVACANIANILLARGTRRTHEMALRVALGASRGRLVRQLLTESVLLSLTGGASGVVLALWGIQAARAIGGFPDVIDPTLNTMVLGFTAAASVLTGVLCGIVPALRASRVAPGVALSAEGGRGASGQAKGRLRAGLVVVQIASAIALAVGASLMLQTLNHRQHVDLGFNPAGAIRADLEFPEGRYGDDGVLTSVVNAAIERLKGQPGVTAVGASAWAMSLGVGAQQRLSVPNLRDDVLDVAVPRSIAAVTPEYFAAMGVPLLQGRAFGGSDGRGTAAVAVVNEELARRVWPGRSPVGEVLRLGGADQAAPLVTIVGVVANVRRSAFHTLPARVYLPYAQSPNRSIGLVVRTRGLVVRATGDLGSVSSGLRATIREVDPLLVMDNLTTVEQDVAQFLAPIRLISWLLAGFGATGLLLAGLGVFGTMSYTVSQRSREMALRIALGADRRDILKLVLGQGLMVTAVGIGFGMIAALVLAQALGSFLYGVAPSDPLTLASVVAFVLAVSLAGCYRPARAAASADPMTVLRRE